MVRSDAYNGKNAFIDMLFLVSSITFVGTLFYFFLLPHYLLVELLSILISPLAHLCGAVGAVLGFVVFTLPSAFNLSRNLLPVSLVNYVLSFFPTA